jgi:hypothetical protein
MTDESLVPALAHSGTDARRGTRRARGRGAGVRRLGMQVDADEAAAVAIAANSCLILVFMFTPERLAYARRLSGKGKVSVSVNHPIGRRLEKPMAWVIIGFRRANEPVG